MAVFLTKKPLFRYSFKIISSVPPAPVPSDSSLVNLANPPLMRKQSLIRHTDGWNEKPPHYQLLSTISVPLIQIGLLCQPFHICNNFQSFSSSSMLSVMRPEWTSLKSSQLQQTQGVSTSLRASSIARSWPPFSPVESMVRFGNFTAMALTQGLPGPSFTTISFLKGYSLNSMKVDSASSSMSWRLQQVRNTTEMLLFSASEKLYSCVLLLTLGTLLKTTDQVGVIEAEGEAEKATSVQGATSSVDAMIFGAACSSPALSVLFTTVSYPFFGYRSIEKSAEEFSLGQLVVCGLEGTSAAYFVQALPMMQPQTRRRTAKVTKSNHLQDALQQQARR